MTDKIKKLENNLITEFKKNPIYHTQALCFINRKVTDDVSDYDISKLMANLSAKLGNEDKVMSHLKDCLILMADTDEDFTRYLQYFADVISDMPILEFDELGAHNIPGEMDKTMNYEIVFQMEKIFPAEKMDEFAISGLGIRQMEYKNLTIDKKPNEKLRELFHFWQQRVPYCGYCDKQDHLPNFTKRGLQTALNKCDLGGVMRELKW